LGKASKKQEIQESLSPTDIKIRNKPYTIDRKVLPTPENAMQVPVQGKATT
jgi:hypothetical protein